MKFINKYPLISTKFLKMIGKKVQKKCKKKYKKVTCFCLHLPRHKRPLD